MKKIVPVQQKGEIISRNILGRKDTMRVTGKNLSGRKNESSFKESSLKEKLQKSVLHVEDQAILGKIVQKRRKQQSFLNKPKSMVMILPSRM